MHVAVYPGTFDPITLGHEDLARRASALFGKVIVAVAASPKKKPLFSLPERVNLAASSLAHFSNIQVLGFSGLLCDFVVEHTAKVVIRGLRIAADFEHEFQLAGMNRCLMPTVEALFLVPSVQHQCISSSMVKEIALLGGKIDQFVSTEVAIHLKKKTL